MSKYDLEKSGFSCNFIEYITKIKTAKNIGNLNITKREWPNIPILLSLVGNKKGCSHIYKQLMSGNGDILSRFAEKWSESLLEEKRYQK